MIGLDSDVLIDFLHEDVDAIAVLKKYRGELATTEINIFEIFDGIYAQKQINKEEEVIAGLFFQSIQILPSSLGCGQIAAQMLSHLKRQGRTIEQTDCFIAAIMQINGCNKIITRNVKHFSAIKGVEIISY